MNGLENKIKDIEDQIDELTLQLGQLKNMNNTEVTTRHSDLIDQLERMQFVNELEFSWKYTNSVDVDFWVSIPETSDDSFELLVEAMDPNFNNYDTLYQESLKHPENLLTILRYKLKEYAPKYYTFTYSCETYGPKGLIDKLLIGIDQDEIDLSKINLESE
jgi:hypothetical protein